MSDGAGARRRALVAYRARNIAAGGAGAVRAAVRRLRRGPTLPSWTWSEELFVAAFRGATISAARHVELMSVGAGRRPTPLARRDRRSLDLATVDLSGVRAERYSPKAGAVGTILRFHGGGFVSGSAATERRVAGQLAAITGCDTYGITYRLGPQHPYPAALDDAVTAYRALLERGTDPSRTVLFGGSAGAGLALATLLRIREESLQMPASGAGVRGRARRGSDCVEHTAHPADYRVAAAPSGPRRRGAGNLVRWRQPCSTPGTGTFTWRIR